MNLFTKFYSHLKSGQKFLRLIRFCINERHLGSHPSDVEMKKMTEDAGITKYFLLHDQFGVVDNVDRPK